jgi:hypothetical protein
MSVSGLSNKGNSNVRVEVSPAAQPIVAHALETFWFRRKGVAVVGTIQCPLRRIGVKSNYAGLPTEV